MWLIMSQKFNMKDKLNTSHKKKSSQESNMKELKDKLYTNQFNKYNMFNNLLFNRFNRLSNNLLFNRLSHNQSPYQESNQFNMPPAMPQLPMLQLHMLQLHMVDLLTAMLPWEVHILDIE
jgi:hypothetical protein